ncbi:MAG: benzoate/H(+) symporter BenE family transporter, partial [Clostridiales bacterium]
AWAGSPECGEVDKRYVAAVWCGIAFALTGIFAPLTIGVLAMLPGEALNVIVGLVLMGMIIDGLSSSFGVGQFKVGSFASFAISMAGIAFMGIGAAFWALLIGTIVSLILERKDYKEMKSQLD